jgi:hypothetical protein
VDTPRSPTSYRSHVEFVFGLKRVQDGVEVIVRVRADDVSDADDTHP